MTFTPPPPPAYPDLADVADDLLAADLLREYDEDLYEYNFQYVWLPMALTPEEYATVRHLQASLLIDMYPRVHEFGPNGPVWFGYCTQLLRALSTSKRGDVVDRALIHDFIDTYKDTRFFQVAQSKNAGEFWNTLYQESIDLQRQDGFLGEIEGMVADEAIGTLVYHRNWGHFAKNTETAMVALEHFTTLVLSEDLLRGLPEFEQAYAAHDAFMASVNWR